MVDARGPVITRAETVTLFNDLCFFAPGELVRPSVSWESVDAHTARARYTLGPNTISATLYFNDAGELVDFSSEDRSTDPTVATPTPQRWTTPARAYRQMGPARLPTRAETRWHPASGAWAYGEFELTSLAYNVRR
jgi:hypothetical protein